MCASCEYIYIYTYTHIHICACAWAYPYACECMCACVCACASYQFTCQSLLRWTWTCFTKHIKIQICMEYQHDVHTTHTLQHTATHCNTLQHTATHCNTLQHTATHCNPLQHTATHQHDVHGRNFNPSSWFSSFQSIELVIPFYGPCLNIWLWRGTSTHCNTLQHTATHCNTLQHTAAHCNTLQHINMIVSTYDYDVEHQFDDRRNWNSSSRFRRRPATRTMRLTTPHPSLARSSYMYTCYIYV